MSRIPPISGRACVIGALLIPLVYLPQLTVGFDYIDDGNLVYPEPPMPLEQRVRTGWAKVVSNFHEHGPFRPAVWAHWEVQAEVLRAHAWRWRAFRLAWTMLACGMMLWLLAELGVPTWPALGAATFAYWNPYRNEVWLSLTLSEGVAMPYAFAALACASRAGRSSRAWAWDIVGIAALIMALLCKNTFAAIVPAAWLLRAAPDGGLPSMRRASTALPWLLTLALPVGHFVYLSQHRNERQYELAVEPLRQFGRMVMTVLGAASLRDAMLPFVGLAGLTLLVAAPARGLAGRVVHAMRSVACAAPAAISVACILMVLGIGEYLLIGGTAGRYSMPAVWGVDLWFAALLTAVAGTSTAGLRRCCAWAFALGTLAAMVSSMDKQDRFAADARVLNDALEHTLEHAPAGSALGWIVSPDLGIEEGVHMQWHLENRGRRDVRVRFFDAEGRELVHRSLPSDATAPVALMVAGSGDPPMKARPEIEFSAPHRFGLRKRVCRMLRAE